MCRPVASPVPAPHPSLRSRAALRVRASAFAVLASLNAVPFSNILKTIVHMVGKPESQAAGVTMLGCLIEKCYERFSDPAEADQLRILRETLARPTIIDAHFAWDMKYVAEALTWPEVDRWSRAQAPPPQAAAPPPQAAAPPPPPQQPSCPKAPSSFIRTSNHPQGVIYSTCFSAVPPTHKLGMLASPLGLDLTARCLSRAAAAAFQYHCRALKCAFAPRLSRQWASTAPSPGSPQGTTLGTSSSGSLATARSARLYPPSQVVARRSLTV